MIHGEFCGCLACGTSGFSKSSGGVWVPNTSKSPEATGGVPWIHHTVTIPVKAPEVAFGTPDPQAIMDAIIGAKPDADEDVLSLSADVDRHRQQRAGEHADADRLNLEAWADYA